MGIDLNTTKLAIVSLDISSLDFITTELKSKNKDWVNRLHDLQEKFEEYIRKENAIDYVIEDIPYVVNKQSYYKLVSVLAMCRVLLYQYDKNCKIVHNSTWKSKTGVIRISKNTKENIKMRAIEVFGEKVNKLNQDIIDALMIAYSDTIITEVI